MGLEAKYVLNIYIYLLFNVVLYITVNICKFPTNGSLYYRVHLQLVVTVTYITMYTE